MEQMSIFDTIQSSFSVHVVNNEGFIPAEDLVPVGWEAWKYSRDDWTLRGGEPYIIDAFLALLPGNRVYAKEWMMYPFMYECKTAMEADKLYFSLRKKIVEREKYNSTIQRTWKVDSLPPLVDMWKYKDGEYGCEEYAKIALYGYQM